MLFPKIKHEKSAAPCTSLSQSTGHTNVYDMTQLYSHKTGSQLYNIVLPVLMEWHLGGDQLPQRHTPSDSLLSQTYPYPLCLFRDKASSSKPYI